MAQIKCNLLYIVVHIYVDVCVCLIYFLPVMQLIDYYVKEKYTLRYTGGMVPDVNQVTN